MKPVEGQEVEVLWDDAGERWLRGTVYRVYDEGADVIVGVRGCWYFRFALIRELRR